MNEADVLEFFLYLAIAGLSAMLIIVWIEWKPYLAANENYKILNKSEIESDLMPETLYQYWIERAYENRFGWSLLAPIIGTLIVTGLGESILKWIGISASQTSAGPVIVAVVALPSLIYVWFLRAYERDRELKREESAMWSSELSDLLERSSGTGPDQLYSIRQLQDYLSGAKWKTNQASNTAAIFQLFSSLVEKHIDTGREIIQANPKTSKLMNQKKDLPLTRTISSVIRGGVGNRGVRVSGRNLSGLNLSYLDLRGTNFSELNFESTRFFYADLIKTNFNKSNLSGADLAETRSYGSNLSHTDMQYSILVNADLSFSDLSHANLSTATAIGARFSQGSLYEATVDTANLQHAVLKRTVVTGATFHASIVTDKEGLSRDQLNQLWEEPNEDD